MVFDPGPAIHTVNFCAFFRRLREHTFELLPSEAQIDSTDAGFFGYIPPAGARPNAAKVDALSEISMLTGPKAIPLSSWRSFLLEETLAPPLQAPQPHPRPPQTRV